MVGHLDRNNDNFFREEREKISLLCSTEWIKLTIFALIVRPKKKKLQMSKHITREQRYAISMML